MIFINSERISRLRMKKKGIVDVSMLLVSPEKHELATANFFANLGKDVVFIRPSNIPDNHRPDFIMNGIEWEVKSPTGKSKRSIIKRYIEASFQSNNIIFDLRRSGLPEDVCVNQLEKLYKQKHTKRLMIITKTDKLIEYPRNCLDK